MPATTLAARLPATTPRPSDDVNELIRRWQRDRDEQARHEIVESLLPRRAAADVRELIDPTPTVSTQPASDDHDGLGGRDAAITA